MEKPSCLVKGQVGAVLMASATVPCSTEIPRQWGALCQADTPGQVPADAAAAPG